MFSLISVAFAQTHTDAACKFVANIEDIILFPLITLLSAVALVVFIWGIFQYVAGAESDEARATGKRHMLWGIIGLTIMVSAFTLLQVFTRTFGITIFDCPI
jgi:hypothetical protein